MRRNFFQTLTSSIHILGLGTQATSFDLILSGFFLNSFISYNRFDMSTESAVFLHTFRKASVSLNSSCHYFSNFGWKKEVWSSSLLNLESILRWRLTCFKNSIWNKNLEVKHKLGVSCFCSITLYPGWMSITSEIDEHEKSREYNIPEELRGLMHQQVQLPTFNCWRKAHYQIKQIDPKAGSFFPIFVIHCKPLA